MQWLELHASTAGGHGFNPGWGTKILHAARCSQKRKKKKKQQQKTPFISRHLPGARGYRDKQNELTVSSIQKNTDG